MKDYLILLGAASMVVVALAGATVWTKYEEVMLTTEQAYQKGFEAGKASVSTPKVCVAWWFGADTKLRHEQAAKAYCKGQK